MFTGIVEAMGKVKAYTRLSKGNAHTLQIEGPGRVVLGLKKGASLAVNGVCLTVVDIKNDNYTVTAIDETLQKTNIGLLNVGDQLNLERCLRVGDRLDGHIVQGHIDQRGDPAGSRRLGRGFKPLPLCSARFVDMDVGIDQPGHYHR